MTAKEKRDYKAEAEWQAAYLKEHGFDPHTVHFGSSTFDMFAMAFGGTVIEEGAVCLTCYSLVPIVDLTNAETAVAAHQRWHGAAS